MVVMEAIGEGLIVEPYLPTVGLGGQFVARGGSAEQKKRLLPEIAQGKRRMAFAHTEPGARYDLARSGCGRAVRATGSSSMATSAWCSTARPPTHWWSRRGRRSGHGSARDQPVPRRSRNARGHRQGVPDDRRAARRRHRVLRHRRRPRRAARPRGRRAAADRGGGGLRHRAPLRGGRRGHPLRQRHHARVPQDAPPVRRADRQLPGAPAPHGRHGHQLRAGALDDVSRLRQGGHRGRRPSAGASSRRRR